MKGAGERAGLSAGDESSYQSVAFCVSCRKDVRLAMLYLLRCFLFSYDCEKRMQKMLKKNSGKGKRVHLVEVLDACQRCLEVAR